MNMDEREYTARQLQDMMMKQQTNVYPTNRLGGSAPTPISLSLTGEFQELTKKIDTLEAIVNSFEDRLSLILRTLPAGGTSPTEPLPPGAPLLMEVRMLSARVSGIMRHLETIAARIEL